MVKLKAKLMKTNYCKLTEYRKNIQFTTAFSMPPNHMQSVLSRNTSHAHISTFNAGDVLDIICTVTKYEKSNYGRHTAIISCSENDLDSEG